MSCAEYDFLGNIVKPKEKHETSTSKSDIIITNNTYDSRFRLITSSISVNNSNVASTIYTYDELGRLKSKTYGNTGITENMEYNIRGWLT